MTKERWKEEERTRENEVEGCRMLIEVGKGSKKYIEKREEGEH